MAYETPGKKWVFKRLASETDIANINTAINNVVNGTTPVSKASTATIATYASSDTSKGTIEERLTNLGFKEGVFTVDGTGAIMSNQIRKQGKYVIANLQMLSASGITINSLSVPPEFRPKSDTTIVMTGYVSTALGTLPSYANATLSTDGTLTTVPITSVAQLSVTNVGWETD